MSRLRLIALSTAALLLSAGLTSCTPVKHCEIGLQDASPKPPIQVAAILAPTSNFVDFSSIITAASTSVQADLGFGKLKTSSGRELSVVLADGTPSLATRGFVEPQGGADYDIQTAIETTYGNFDLVAQCAAGDLQVQGDQIKTDKETDLLAALSVAADQLSDDKADKKIYVLGNGIQTAGAIKMQETGQFPTSEKYAQQLAQGLKDIGALPDLHGTNVYWYGLGQVDGTKQKLSQKNSDSLSYFWQEVIGMSNGVLLTIDIHGKVGSGEPNANAIPVAPVDPPTCSLVVKLYEKDGVQFQPDSNVFVDAKKAKAAAKNVSDSFIKAECTEMTVHGYAAAGVDKASYDSQKDDIDETNKALTLLRAKAFAALVKRAGFTGTINTDGVGTCGTEWNASGKIASELQKLCRRVEVSN
ncbi:MAG: hypothetical protein NTX78_03675 [Rhodoluna sp.]|nr:hypothetical protein [Rhodoluna sp.]